LIVRATIYSMKVNYTKEKLEEICKQSYSIAQVLVLLGLKPRGRQLQNS
jgi:hypothetical protein